LGRAVVAEAEETAVETTENITAQQTNQLLILLWRKT